ncbi:MAG: hypothetical protein IJF55_03110 [Clostridia bacterium]|jgi:hypothetical protein|nr:hypothetical protein [Clostridia bacterium]
MSRRKKEEIIVSSSQVSDIIAAEELLEKRISDAALEFGKYSACESITTLYTTEYLPEGKEGSLSERPSDRSYFKVYTLSLFDKEYTDIDSATENGRGFSFVILTFCEAKNGSYTLTVNETGLFDIFISDIISAASYIDEYGVDRFFYRIYNEDEKHESAFVNFLMKTSKKKIATALLITLGVIVILMATVLLLGGAS